MDIKSISEIKLHPNNPRIIKDDKFKLLVKSIKEFPEMLEKRPIVVDETMTVLGGNMRLRACKEAGLKEVPVMVAENWTEEQKKEFIIKDNVGFGEWDMDILANDWDVEQLEGWGFELPKIDDIDFDNIESNEDRSNSDKTKIVECPSCGDKISI